VLVCVVSLTSCGDLPKPFAPSGEYKENPLIALVGGGAIKVIIDPDLPEFLAKPLSDFMVKSLLAENVPASSEPSFGARYLLWGQIKILNPSVFEVEKIEISWSLTSLSDEESYQLKYVLTGEHVGWLFLDKDPLRNLREDMGRDVVQLLYNKQVFQQATSEVSPVSNLRQKEKMKKPGVSVDSLIFDGNPKIFVSGVIGAPGDGNESLVKNLRRIMISAGAKTVDKRLQSNFLIKGFVNVSLPYDSFHRVAITWLVTTKDGRELGKASQKSKVPAGTVNARWGKIAEVVAQEGSVGIVEIIKTYMEPGWKKDKS